MLMDSLRDITAMEYQLLVGQLDDLPGDEANRLRSRLAEKYYAYLDKRMQLKMAAQEYNQVTEDLQSALSATQEMKI